ncbi:uncharacterized protein [Dendropsophus ebraccatus]|uniref:uncharacterized protein n=1 Tax=Dendropsophus ebraccatus TaxID=150705 RepID=UPI003831B432
MVNVFLKYSIAIPFLIILLTRAYSRPCVPDRKQMLQNQENVLVRNIDYVKLSLAENFTTVCKTKKDTSLTFLDLCNDSAKVDETRGNFKTNCYNYSRNLTMCCQFKNLAYLACLLKHQTRNLKRSNSSAVTELHNRLSSIVRYNEELCLNSANKKQRSTNKLKGHSKEDYNPDNGRSCKEIHKINETLQSYATSWQEFRASNDCT